MKKYYEHIILMLSIFFLSLDQFSKWLVLSNYPFGFNLTEFGNEIINNFFYITYVKNYGAAWGILSNNVYFLCMISFIVFIVLFIFVRNEKNYTKYSIIYYSLIFGGLLGNLMDRMFNGYVVDFLNFYIFGYDYPVFNLADTFIVLGVFLLIVTEYGRDIYGSRKRKRKN